MKKLASVLQWVDDNLVKLLLFAFILIAPLYPKTPFIDLEYTYISVRLEDFFIALLLAVFGIQLLRRKITLNTKFLLWFVLFWGAVFLSFVVGAYVLKTIPVVNIGFLHAARRVEYMIIFFIALSTVRSRKDVFTYLRLILITMGVAALYGLGQKFLGFPAVQTMNPEFARGHILYLTPEARISSTFAGHYDFAAYLVLLMPLVLSFFITRKNIVYFLLFLLSLFALVLTASRISSIAYLVSIIAFLVYIRKWTLLVVVVLLSLGMSMFSQNLTSRWLKTFQIKQIFVNQQTGQVVVPQKITSKELPAGSFYLELDKKKTNVTATDEALLAAQLLDDLRREASLSGRTLTAGEEESLLATRTAELTAVNTVVSDISFATRLQVEWPRAINAFLKSPAVGTGPSSITEATDNDYLRWIGEFGALGAGLFLFILYSIAMFIWTQARAMAREDKKDAIIYYGFLFGFAGLMLNAAYIDVFEASKVAYQFWLMSGLLVGSLIERKTKS